MRIVITAILLILCTCADFKNENYEISSNLNGGIYVLDKTNGRILVLNQSGRIIDAINLKLNETDVNKIKQLKSINDKKIKVNYWPSFRIPNDTFTVTFASRYYKDNCLFKVTIEPYLPRLGTYGGFEVKSIHLSDSSSFTLEDIDLSRFVWTRLIDNNGNPMAFQLDGKIPMTLENYMEISDWSCTWKNSSRY